MHKLNVEAYVQQEKDKLKAFAQQQGIDKKIKLGIITTTIADNNILEDFKYMGWKAAVYHTRSNETSFNNAIIRALNHKCTGITIQPIPNNNITLYPYTIPKIFDCGGRRPDSEVNPTIPQGIIDYLKACDFPFVGKTAVILGRSNMIGKPMARLLLNEDMTISICHSKSDPNIVSGLLCDADLVICATGCPHLITRGQCTKAVVIDLGISYQNNDLVGDFEEQSKFCSDSTWSVSIADNIDSLTRLALLKNCMYLTNQLQGE